MDIEQDGLKKRKKRWLNMACLEYRCPECSWGEFSNNLHDACPKCGHKVLRFFDEWPECQDEMGEDNE